MKLSFIQYHLFIRYFVSPHAPRVGRDARVLSRQQYGGVSIHAPHAGRDRSLVLLRSPCPSFQATRPMRGATIEIDRTDKVVIVSIHAPHAGRDLVDRPIRRAAEVSIHAPHAGRDSNRVWSRLPTVVSIHAPHAGRDKRRRRSSVSTRGFNPRAPCGARQVPRRRKFHLISFNPRAPCGARQVKGVQTRDYILVSIHAPHAGRDCLFGHNDTFIRKFQSTRPMRGAT